MTETPQRTTISGPPLDLQELQALLAAEGFAPGTPAHLSPDTVAADQRVCRRMRCPHCRERGMTCRPHTDGLRYRVVASCPSCNAAEEV